LALGDQDDASRRSSTAQQRFGGPLALSKVHWVRPELVAEITYMSWADDGLLRHTVFLGLREDKPALRSSARSAAGATRLIKFSYTPHPTRCHQMSLKCDGEHF
jgi:ATP-dependent DNA ligase